jgi:hypothetical protein
VFTLPNRKTYVHAFRACSSDEKKLQEIHGYFKEQHSALVEASNMHNLHQWTVANTLEVIVREVHGHLIKEGKIVPKED